MSVASSETIKQSLDGKSDSPLKVMPIIASSATAVEDKLQDEVPEVISDLQDADIKVWMLTGDKFETAENIARSCRLIKSDFEVYRLKDKSDVKKYCSDSFADQNENLMASQKRRALIVENTALSYIMEVEAFQFNFIRVSKTCEAVICCRLRPGQKADVVRMIKKDDKNVLTLAIGDGANDVAMISEAHVGTGIYGNEGLRAVQASDFAIPEFKMLRRLLLFHGRTRYLAMSKFILYFFYKNCVLSMPQFYFASLSGYSAMSVFDDFYIQLYNTIFTAAPPVIFAILYWDLQTDIDGPDYEALIPQLYYVGQHRKAFNLQRFILVQTQGIFDAAVIFYFAFQPVWEDTAIINAEKGYAVDMWTSSVASFTALIFVVHFNLLTRIEYFTWGHLVGIIFLSIVPYLIYMWASNYLPPEISQTQYSVEEAHRTAWFYLTIACCIGTCFIVDYAIYSYFVVFRTSPTDFLKQMIYQKKSINDPQNKAIFDQLVAEETRKARVKQSQQRKVAYLKKVQLKQHLQFKKTQISKANAMKQSLEVIMEEHVSDTPKLGLDKPSSKDMKIQPQSSAITDQMTPEDRRATNSFAQSMQYGIQVKALDQSYDEINDRQPIDKGSSFGDYVPQTTQKFVDLNHSSMGVSPVHGQQIAPYTSQHSLLAHQMNMQKELEDDSIYQDNPSQRDIQDLLDASSIQPIARETAMLQGSIAESTMEALRRGSHEQTRGLHTPDLLTAKKQSPRLLMNTMIEEPQLMTQQRTSFQSPVKRETTTQLYREKEKERQKSVQIEASQASMHKRNKTIEN